MISLLSYSLEGLPISVLSTALDKRKSTSNAPSHSGGGHGAFPKKSMSFCVITRRAKQQKDLLSV